MLSDDVSELLSAADETSASSVSDVVPVLSDVLPQAAIFAHIANAAAAAKNFFIFIRSFLSKNNAVY